MASLRRYRYNSLPKTMAIKGFNTAFYYGLHNVPYYQKGLLST